MVFDYRNAPLSPEDRALCDYAVKLTLTPGKMNSDDIDTLKNTGFSEPQITIATQVISYFNYINRIADGLGVDPEDWMTPSKEEWFEKKGKGYGCSNPQG